MATLAVLNTATTGTAISSSEYNDNMTRIRAAVNTIDAAQLNTDSVTTAKIVDANVTADKLATDSVTETKILDATITAAKLAAATITSLKSLYFFTNTTRVLTTANGDVPYIGFGFQPDFVEIAVYRQFASNSIGISDGTHESCLINYPGVTGAWGATDAVAYAWSGASDYNQINVKSFDADGLTLTYTKSGSADGTAVILIRAYKF